MERRTVAVDLGVEPWVLARPVIEGLNAAGYVAVFVGGCVRDHVLGVAVKDLDVASDASPDQVEGLFERCVTVGKQFGVTVVLVPGGEVEVAAFRCDGAYVDGRRPIGVVAASEAEDVQRRDFTINALVLDPIAGEIRDHVGGLADLDARVLRVVGDPMARLREDRLRVLRGLRFAAQLQLEIEPETWAALLATPLQDLSRERIWDEWFKALSQPRRSAWLSLLGAARLSAALCPLLTEVDDHEQRIARLAVEGLPDQVGAEVAVAAMLLAVDPDRLDAWLREEPLSKRSARQIAWLVRWGRPQAWQDVAASQRRRRMLEPEAEQLQHLVRAVGTHWPHSADFLSEMADLQANPPQRLLDAAGLMALGVQPGPGLGVMLEAVWDAQLVGEIRDRAGAEALARRLISEQ